MNLIEVAIENALASKSKLTPEAFQPGGFTSPAIRHLMNNMGAIHTNYLEIGTHRGALSVATMYENKLRGTFVDNWAEFNETDAREDFLRNHEKFLKGSKFLEKDCFSIEPHEIEGPIDLYLYDAAHDTQSQARALTYFYDFMADAFLLAVDDYDWEDVQKGTRQGIEICGLQIEMEKHLSGPAWWNGFGLFYLIKT